jgi:hypothetical protein
MGGVVAIQITVYQILPQLSSAEEDMTGLFDGQKFLKIFFWGFPEKGYPQV